MQRDFETAIIGAIKQDAYRFVKDKLGNNYLAVVPMDRTQIEYLQIVETDSFFEATRREVINHLKSEDFTMKRIQA